MSNPKELKFTFLNKCNYAGGKWIEFWTGDNDSEKWDMCSKTGYFYEALEKANMYDYFQKNGCKGIKITWEKWGGSWEIKCIGFRNGKN